MVSAVKAPGLAPPSAEETTQVVSGPSAVTVAAALAEAVSVKKSSLSEARARVAEEAKSWMTTNMGERFKLQPKSRSRDREHAGTHNVIASEAEMAGALAEGVGNEWAMANLSAAREAEDGSKLVYVSTGMAVRLAPTPPYVAPNTEVSLGGHSVDKLTPDVDGIRVAVAQHVPLHMEWGYTVGTKQKEKNGFIILEVTRRHSQLEAHLYKQVATLVGTLRVMQDSADAMGAPTTGLQESLQVMEARVQEWDKRELSVGAGEGPA